MYSACSRFHSNRFTFWGVIGERVNTAKTRRKVNPIFGWSLASSRINISQLIHGFAMWVVVSGIHWCHSIGHIRFLINLLLQLRRSVSCTVSEILSVVCTPFSRLWRSVTFSILAPTAIDPLCLPPASLNFPGPWSASWRVQTALANPHDYPENLRMPLNKFLADPLKTVTEKQTDTHTQILCISVWWWILVPKIIEIRQLFLNL